MITNVLMGLSGAVNETLIQMTFSDLFPVQSKRHIERCASHQGDYWELLRTCFCRLLCHYHGLEAGILVLEHIPKDHGDLPGTLPRGIKVQSAGTK